MFALVFLASFSSWGLITGPQLKRPIEEALVVAPLSALAAITRSPPQTLLARFAAHGIAARASQSLHELAAQTQVDENELLAIAVGLR